MSDQYTLPLQPNPQAQAIVQGDGYRFTVLTDCLLRMEYQSEGRFTDCATQTAICRKFPVPAFRVVEQDHKLEIITEKLHLYYDKRPFSPEGLTIQLKGGFHNGFSSHGVRWRYGDPVFDLKGTVRTLDGVNGATELEGGLLSRGGFTVLDDSRTALIAADQWIEPRPCTGLDLYFFGYGHDYLGCLRDFYHLSGRPPLVPRFALGNWWSRYHQYTAESYLALMEEFEKQQVPLSVAVLDMDWHLVDIPPQYGAGWTGYTWNRDLFPDPPAFLTKLHDKGLHVTLNLHPADGVRAHEEAYPAMAQALGVDSAHGDKIPFEATDRRFMKAYFTYLHHPHEEAGVDFWWVDWQQGQNSGVAGVDPLWMLNHLHFLDSGRAGRLPLTLSRYAGIGSHRYPIGFSGDTITTWDSLAFQPYFTANASNVGYTWWSHDIGGHMLGSRDDELTVRWLQFGVFSPILRLHSSNNRFYGKEPWNYGPQARPVLASFLRLRHKLIPYLYTMDYLTAEEGLPLLRPMYYHHDVHEAYNVPNQYYFGTQMIVCPITTPADARSRLAAFHAWLPEGTYYDFFTHNVYRGGKKLTLYRSLNRLPVLVPAGGILPLAGDAMSNPTANPEVLEVQVYHGAAGEFTLIEDDCSGRRGAPVQRTRFTCQVNGTHTALHMEQQGKTAGVIPRHRAYHIKIFGLHTPRKVDIRAKAQASWQYDAGAKTLHIQVCGDNITRFSIHIEPEQPGIAGQDVAPQLFTLLNNAWIEYEKKEQIYSAVTAARSPAAALAALVEMGVEPALLGAVTELLTMGL